MPVKSGLSPLLTDILYGRSQRVTIPEAVIIQFVLLKMSKVLSKHVKDYNVTYILLWNKGSVH